MGFLRLEGLVKRYGEFTAVEKIDLDVEKGEFVSLLGPSGCGKTTTLQMIAGFTPPTDGRVFIDGRDITHEKPNRRNLGIVFQSYALFPHMTVAQNVAFGLEMRRTGRKERRERVADALELVQLTDFADRFPRALSGGQRQRVALARALVIRPEVLLLDEPLSALDAKIREDMQIELREIQRRIGTTTILVTHDQAEAMAMSDRIAVMNKGRLAQVDKPFRAYEHPGDSFVSNFLGKSNSFAGTVRSAGEGLTVVESGGMELQAGGSGFGTGTPVLASIRPEKVVIGPSGSGTLDGTVEARIFLGNHWVFRIATPAGPVTVTSHNAEPQSVEEGESVGLRWRPEDVRLLRQEAPHAV